MEWVKLREQSTKCTVHIKWFERIENLQVVGGSVKQPRAQINRESVWGWAESLKPLEWVKLREQSTKCTVHIKWLERIENLQVVV